jgi:hypothetical protein
MCQNPGLARAMADDRAMHLRQSAPAGSRDRRRSSPRHVVRAVRRAAGWLLVDLGLRLALPRRAITQQPLARRAGHP